MPVATAGLADVLIGDDYPAVALGLDQHPLEQAPVGLLGVGSPPELALGVAQAEREGVAGALELTGRQDPRSSQRADLPFEAAAREGGGEQLAQSSLEPGDLVAKVRAGAALAGFGDARSGRRRGEVDLIEQLGQWKLLCRPVA
jgi:hypothetical protein